MLIRTDMTDRPQSGSLLKQACVLREDIFSEQLQMVGLPQKVGTSPCLYQLTVEVNRILDGLVLDGEDLDTLDDLIEEEFAEDIGRDSGT